MSNWIIATGFRHAKPQIDLRFAMLRNIIGGALQYRSIIFPECRARARPFPPAQQTFKKPPT